MSRHGQDQDPPAASARHLRLLSYNIQVGLHTRDYGHMVSGAWRHVLPFRRQHDNLDRIAELLSEFDFVGIQEADAGSARTRSRNQIEYLAARAGFNHCGYTVTRDLRPMARHCHGWMSRVAPQQVQSHSLPSQIPGRAAMKLDFDDDLGRLTILLAHLSLGPRDRRQQLAYLGAMAARNRRVVLMGDLNSGDDFLRHHPELAARGLQPVHDAPKTYPSWKPRRALDQVLATPDVSLLRVEALPLQLSDHKPLAVEVALRPQDDDD